MRKFVILDRFVQFAGWHHFEYAVQMFQAAERQSWQPVLGAHWDLGHDLELPPHWDIYRAFREVSEDDEWVRKCHRMRYRTEAAQQASDRLPFFKRCEYQVRQWRYQRHYERLKRSFGGALDKISTGCGLRAAIRCSSTPSCRWILPD